MRHLRTSLLALSLLSAAALSGCGGDDGASAMSVPARTTEETAKDLAALGGARVLFGHQSVGRNILDGLKALSGKHSAGLRLEEASAGPGRAHGPGIENIKVGKNTDPDSKCDDFLRRLEAAGDSYDAVIMKFCYVDLDDKAQVDALFARYKEFAAKAKALAPSAVLVHATVPVYQDQPGWKPKVKRMLGRDPDGEANVRRNAFNARLRKEFSGEPIFDIAAAESTRPDGSRASFRGPDGPVYTLAPEWTYDGGHLNDAGKEKLAAEFARVLAAALAAKTPAQAGG